MAVSKYLEKKAWITGKTVVGIDPGKERHQAVVIDGQAHLLLWSASGVAVRWSAWVDRSYISFVTLE